jgi:putative FmdB family regulatory protein
MPTYEYECEACGKSFEIFQSISEEAKRKCPACRKNRLRRLISSGGGLIFRGSGFYITDYRSSDYQAKAKAEAEGGKSPAGAGDGKPDAAGSKAGASQKGAEKSAGKKAEKKAESKLAGAGAET